MIGVYFSGTGNTKYCISEFLKEYNNSDQIEAYSIEDEECIGKIKENRDIVLAYPIYYSNLPPLVKEFLKNNKEIFKDKNIFIICTMGLFSGDGAGLSARLLKKCGAHVLGGLHLKMPDCIGDVKLLKKSLEENKQVVVEAKDKITKAVLNLKQGKYSHDGLRIYHHIAGLFGQRLWFYNKTKTLRNKLKIDYTKCVGCNKCVMNCPASNLKLKDGKPFSLGKCGLCYRCISNCPKKAITLIGKEVYQQSKIRDFLQ